jgi:molybdate transport system substrate-binding protein
MFLQLLLHHQKGPFRAVTLIRKEELMLSCTIQMKIRFLILGGFFFSYMCCQTFCYAAEGKTLEVFAGAASKPATEEAAQLFENKTGIRVLLHFGGSGKMLADMKLTGRGDIYFPGSSDFMELAKKEGLVQPQTEERLIYLIPSINVPKGNPKKILSLADLTRPGVSIGIGRPDTVCLGLYAVEIFEKNKIAEAVRGNIKTHAESCDKVAQLVALGMVDAVIGWSVLSVWNPDKIETILIQPQELPRIGYIPIALSSFSKNPDNARKFISFLQTDEARAVFKKWGYLVTEAEARKYVLPSTPVGGQWELPVSWR